MVAWTWGWDVRGGAAHPPLRREKLPMALLTMALLTMAAPPLRREELRVPRATLEGEQRAIAAAEQERRERGQVRRGHGPAGEARGRGGLECSERLERGDVPQRHRAVAGSGEVEPLVRHAQEAAHGNGVAQRRAGGGRARHAVEQVLWRPIRLLAQVDHDLP